jgi:Peptidase family M28/PDZ domain/PA domain
MPNPMPKLLLTLTCLATTPLFALASESANSNTSRSSNEHTTAGPETADEVRKRRAQRQLEKNRRKLERDAKSIEMGDLPEIDQTLVEDFTQMLSIIADPKMEGRIPGSRGIEDAADYIESHLVDLGLTPAFSSTDSAADGTEVITPFSSFRQEMQMGSQTSATTQRLIIGSDQLEPNTDFSTLAYSGTALITAPVVFTGYAIVSGPNNYLGFETNESVEGKIAICLNYEPMDDEGNSQWREGDWSHNSRLTYKVTALERRGAAAVIIVSPPEANDDRVEILETIESTSPPSNRMGAQTGPEYDIPVIHATPKTASTILAHCVDSEGNTSSLEELTLLANEAGIVQPLGDKAITIDIGVERTPRLTTNVGAILPGKGELKDEYVVIGAHYDHVGYGKFGTRTPARRGEVHPGADDNGTGTTANLLAAKTLVQRNQLLAEDQSARSILFLWFTAEESGLNGSRFYVENPIAPIDDHVIMLNMDMIGTLSDGLLEIGGFNSAPGFEDMATPHLKDAAIPFSEDVSVGSGRSDHASFDAVGIPNLFFFTGLHERYHSPDDTIDLIDNEGCVRVALLVSSMAYDAATRYDRLVHPMSREDKPEKDGPNVRVGIIPSNNAKGGMKIERIFEDTSASQAGLQTGDIIIKWDDQEISSVETWMPIITANEPGDVVTVTVMRANQEIELEMTLRPIE